MIGRAPRWMVIVVGVDRLHLDHPDHRHRRHLHPPASEDVVLGWWRLDNLTFTLSAWIRVWSKYRSRQSFVVTAQLAAHRHRSAPCCSRPLRPTPSIS